MRVAVSGSTGLIGSAVVSSFERDGHDVARIVRHRDQAGPGDVYWSAADDAVDAAALEGVDAVVHLSGEPIGERWSPQQKQRIHDSRVQGTRLLAEALASLDDGPDVFVSSSAVGYYGSRGDEVLTETSEAGDDFLARVCIDWESAAAPAADAGIRVVHPRTGVVIHEDGPLIDKIELPFRLGVGGRVGSGDQWVPWISLDDEVAALRFLVDHELSGPVNLVGPTPVTNAEMTDVIGDVIHRPTILPVPVFAIRALYGEMGVTLATASQRALPTVLQEAGFTHVDPTLRSALEKAL